MDDLVKQHFAIFFPVFFAAMWLTVTSLLGLLSGWYFLMNKYPDRYEEPLLRAKYQSGSMGLGVSMSCILTISVCRSGLRVGIMRLFGPFCRDFFVPWEEIRVRRLNRFLFSLAELEFGDFSFWKLKIMAGLANRLASAAQGRWPEPGQFPKETK
ncbi:MAG: hypothetical protein ACLPX9_12675 [Rhodomicrobium sp.]